MDNFLNLFQVLIFGPQGNIFVELAIILIIAGVTTYLLHFLKQPSIIAYILVGLIIGPFGLYKVSNGEVLHGLADIGITLLLFMVGLDLDFSQLKKIGKTAVYAGIGQVVLTCLVGFGIIKLLGFGNIAAWYIAIALTFSSTIIVVKLLTEKKDMQSLYGKLAVGIFLIQDVAAIIILIVLSGLTSPGGGNNYGITGGLIFILAKAFMAGVVVIWLSRYVFPKVIKTINKSDELMLLFALGWSLGLAAVFNSPLVGFNAAIGGFVAGLALANTGVHHQISGRIKSLRDFFIIIFFLVLGSQLVFNNIGKAIVPALALSLFVLIGKPLIVSGILGFMGYKPRTSFMTGVTLAQVSEFSLILIALGLSYGHLNQNAVTVVTLAGIITIAISSYGILYAGQLYNFLKKPLEIFNFHRKTGEIQKIEQSLSGHVVLIGAHRLGSHIIGALSKTQDDVLIIDFNPDVARHGLKKNFHLLIGDIADPYIQEIGQLSKAKLIVSTVPDLQDNLALLEFLNKKRRKSRTIFAAYDEDDAHVLYKAGADYVLLPHFIGGEHLAGIVNSNQDLSGLEKIKKKHLKAMAKHQGN